MRTVLLLLVFVAVIAAPASAATAPAQTVRVVHVPYRAFTGRVVHATVLLPASYDPQRDAPVPLVISPHGRGLDGDANARLWGDLPARDGFVVVNPDGAGEHLSEIGRAHV